MHQSPCSSTAKEGGAGTWQVLPYHLHFINTLLSHCWISSLLLRAQHSKQNPLGCSSSIFFCPAQRFPAFIFPDESFSLFLAQVQAHVPGSVALGPDPVGCAAITFPWAAIPKVGCLKHTRTHGLPSLLFALTLGIHSHHSRLHFGRDADSNSPGATSLWKVSCLHSHLCVFLSLFKAGCAVSYVGGNPSCAAVLRHCCWDKCSQAMSFTYLLWLLMLEWSWLLQELL